MKPPQPKLPKQTQARHHEQESSQLRGKQLEALVLERFELPDQVAQFNQFEELSKLYEIGLPFVPRTQVELQFSVFDGRRLQQGGLFGSLDGGENANLPTGPAEYSAEQHQQQANQTGQKSSLVSSDATGRRLSYAASHERNRAGAKHNNKEGSRALSWGRFLFANKNQTSTFGQGPASPFRCCLKPSDTNQELGLLSLSTSGQSLGVQVNNNNNNNNEPGEQALKQNAVACSVRAALAPQPDDDLETSETKREALRVLASALAPQSRPVDLFVGQTLAAESSLGPALALESAQMELTGGCVSVCLLDRRHLIQHSHKHTNPKSHESQPALVQPPNGRQWARASARLVQLRRKLRLSALAPIKSCYWNSSASIQKQLERVARKASRRFWLELARDNLARLPTTFKSHQTHKLAGASSSGSSSSSGEVSAKSRRLEAEQLIELVKGSLNQLIDAQLLLRNKLTGLNDQQGSSMAPIVNQVRGAEYEQLLRNNFNLLKIWQNLEETERGLVCFVCEPIKATLADLFWFNRQRVDWPQAQAFEAFSLNSNTTPSNGSTNGRCLHFSSPLVCLDANQVKRGLLQILEALNFLHGVCKLIHRDLNPNNILVCQNDNWKLSGLEFAIRFESTTISESASMMAHEFGQRTQRFATTGSGASSLSMNHTSSSSGPLRRQRTLHQTKCQEFVRRPKSSPLLQPNLDYVAPEILRQAKCSHKSDLFSFGLILGQVYDLCSHEPPISCRAQVQNYESELRKLDERRKAKLVQLVPPEMRLVLEEMLDSEPNLRPSANHVLQIVKRPLELCKSNEDSLRHLKSSLDYLETRFANQNPSLGLQQAADANTNKLSGGKCSRRTTSYFRRVTSASVNQALGRKQTQTLQMLSRFVQAGEAIALAGSPARSSPEAPLDRCVSICSLRLQAEHTLETLRQVLKSSELASNSGPGAECCPADTRSLLLLVALHRRLLEQVGQLRAELPPLCRLIAPTSGASGQPLDRSLLSANHRALADLEERLQLTIAQQSIGRLSESLADPLLKLEEFLLVFELLNDLVGFVGQKCKQNLGQRTRQLLNELTPITGCPSLSSSEEEEDDDELDQAELGEHSPRDQFQAHALAGSSMALAMQGNSNTTAAGSATNLIKRMSQQSQQPLDRPSSRQQLYNLPTSINVTAPSPMGSTRDVSRIAASQQFGGESPLIESSAERSQTSAIKRHSHQDVLANCDQQLIDKTSQISLGSGGSASSAAGRRSIANCQPAAAAAAAASAMTAQDEPQEEEQDEKSRSKLMDELLRTINDDKFNEFIDLNNKLSAATKLAAANIQPDQVNCGGGGQMTDLANANRPKSALGGGGGGNSSSWYPTGGRQTSGRQSAGSPRPPQTLNLASSGQSTSQRSGYQARGSICVPSAQQQQSSTFDNVIRRMSTNLVQNFNKIGAGATSSQQQQAQLSEMSGSANTLRREKSSTSTYTNSLYVENQVPARRHSDNTINVPHIQVALSSPSSSSSRTNLNQRASLSASKLATKWKITAKTNQRDASDKLSPNLGGALGYIRRHSSGNTQQGGGSNEKVAHHGNGTNDQNQSNGLGAQLLNASPFKTKSSSNLGIDFLMGNRSMKRRCSAASMLGHQTQRKAEDLIDAGMKSVQNMFN